MAASSQRRRTFLVLLLCAILLLIATLPLQSPYLALVRTTVFSESDQHTTTTTTDQQESTNMQQKDILGEASLREMMTKPAQECFYVEDLCHMFNRFFYRKDYSKHQPPFVLELYTNETKVRHDGYLSEYATTELSAIIVTDDLKCTTSPIMTHIIFYSHYNDMLGEFYDRSIRGLYELMTESLAEAATARSTASVNDFVSHSQLYIHRMVLTKPMMDSHRLFASAFQSSHTLGDLVDLLDATKCQCLPQCLFCGYQIEAKSDNRRHLVPSAGVRMQGTRDEHSPTYAKMREFLRLQLVTSNQFAMADIQKYRRGLLLDHLKLTNSGENNSTSTWFDYASKWKIIGLAQRSGRRRWLELPALIQNLTHSLHQHHVLLVETNLDDAHSWTPYHHLIRHAALDALVGIHGAQLTEAVWMPPGSLVVELLPYIPEDISHGWWTKTTHKATPLGRLFDGTELVHVGYKLGRESAPYCYEDVENVSSAECWNADNHPWDGRDFLMSDESVRSLIDSFIIHRPTTCQGYADESLPSKNVVVYNAPCSSSSATQDEAKPEHFYWAE